MNKLHLLRSTTRGHQRRMLSNEASDRPMVRLSTSKYKRNKNSKIGSDYPVMKGTVSPFRPVPAHIPAPPYAKTNGMVDPASEYSIFDLQGDELQKMRDACAFTSDILAYAGELVKPGVTTDEIDRMVFDKVVSQGVYPSPVNYCGFPKTLCTSINEVVCHGIPDDRPLREGDIVNLDVSCYINGYHGDTSKTFLVGQVSDEARHLVDVTEAILMESIDMCGPGVEIKKLGALSTKMCKEHGYEASKTFAGHGIGSTFHMLPYVLATINDYPGEMVPGMVFTIEPAVCQGSQKHFTWDDGWTAATIDGGLSAQFEHTVLITDNGAEILT